MTTHQDTAREWLRERYGRSGYNKCTWVDLADFADSLEEKKERISPRVLDNLAPLEEKPLSGEGEKVYLEKPHKECVHESGLCANPTPTVPEKVKWVEGLIVEGVSGRTTVYKPWEATLNANLITIGKLLERLVAHITSKGT